MKVEIDEVALFIFGAAIVVVSVTGWIEFQDGMKVHTKLLENDSRHFAMFEEYDKKIEALERGIK